jgi:cysteine desulfurase
MPPKTIYADYQATTPVDPRVVGQMEPHWREAFGNPHSNDHVIGWRAADAVKKAATSVASLVGADPDEVIFTSGATEANNLALLGLARRADSSRRRILVSAIEHKCVLAAPRSLIEQNGFAVEFIPVDDTGLVDLDALRDMVDETVLVVSIMAVNNEIGTIQDIGTISKMLLPFGVLLHCDAAQAPCAMDMGHMASQVDLISLSGHKVYGPKGIGALFIRRDVQHLVEPLIYGGGQQNGLRSGTVPTPLCVGMATAVDILRSPEGPTERKRVARQRDSFVSLLKEEIPSVVLNGPTDGLRHAGNANLRFNGLVAQDILGSLQPHLAASTGAACTTGIPEPSHVLRAIGLSEKEAESSIRFSFGRFTTDNEIEEAIRLVTLATQHWQALNLN